jgi:hypothetical protein
VCDSVIDFLVVGENILERILDASADAFMVSDGTI